MNELNHAFLSRVKEWESHIVKHYNKYETVKASYERFGDSDSLNEMNERKAEAESVVDYFKKAFVLIVAKYHYDSPEIIDYVHIIDSKIESLLLDVYNERQSEIMNTQLRISLLARIDTLNAMRKVAMYYVMNNIQIN